MPAIARAWHDGRRIVSADDRRRVFLSTGIVVFLLFSACRPAAPPEVPPAEEQCLACHRETTGLSVYHNPAALGCVSCHRGDPTDSTEAGGHRGLIAVPGNLATVDASCGGCHADIVARVRTSLMATGRGLVAVDRFVFGEQDTPDGLDGLDNLGDSPADSHLRQLCSPCHLGTPKATPGPVTELSRGGGCVACHLQETYPRSDTTHPALTLAVGDDHCFGCHSRSGRISTNYQGWHETTLGPDDATPGDTTYRLLADGRVFERRPADAHHALGLVCIDCHTSRETMGDGTLYRHQEEAVEIACTTCHTADSPPTLGWDDLDLEAQKLVAMRRGKALTDHRFVRTTKPGRALTNVFLDSLGGLVLQGKLSGRRFALSPPADACTRPGHERVSCQSCHTAWAPQCLGCHTQRDPQGQWHEFVSDFLAEAPTLGVREDTVVGTSRIEPFAPGMILTLNANARPVPGDVDALAAEGTFHRLFAPAAPHTVSREGRTCASCHNDPLALGAGRGTLVLRTEPAPGWTFTPAYALLGDGLPADAWTAFLGTRPVPYATRRDARPFTRREQQRIIRVGACLTCHPPTPENQARMYDRFEEALRRTTLACRVTPVDAESGGRGAEGEE